MKTSVIEVRDMLSVLSVPGLEKRIGEVPGVESATVNYAAGNVTVRYDETRLDIADIKSDVRQSGYESAAPARVALKAEDHKGHTAPSAPPATPSPTVPKAASDAAAASTAPKAEGHEKPAAVVAQPSAAEAGVANPSAAIAPKSAASKSAAASPTSAVTAGDGKQDKAATEKR